MDKDNFEDACCWNEEENCVYGFESISPTIRKCLGCGEKYDEDEWSVNVELTKNEIILNALKEYEKNHWATESQVWQKKINSLIEGMEC